MTNQELRKKIEKIRNYIIDVTIKRLDEPNEEFDKMYQESVDRLLQLFSLQQKELKERFFNESEILNELCITHLLPKIGNLDLFNKREKLDMLIAHYNKNVERTNNIFLKLGDILHELLKKGVR